MTRIIIFLLTITLIYSCKETANGPCDYYQYEALAKVKSIDPYEKDGKKLYHVALKFNSSSLKDEIQYLDELKNIEIDSTFISVNKIMVGYNYKAMVSEIKEGNCEPLYVSFNHHFKGAE